MASSIIGASCKNKNCDNTQKKFVQNGKLVTVLPPKCNVGTAATKEYAKQKNPDNLLVELMDLLMDIDAALEYVEELMEFGIGKLSNLAQTFTEITDPSIRFRFQKWLFFVGLVFDGKRFGASKIPLILSVKQSALAGVLEDSNHVFESTVYTNFTTRPSAIIIANQPIFR